MRRLSRSLGRFVRRSSSCLALAAALLVTPVSACGDGTDTTAATAPATVRLALDFTPNATHAPVYGAVAGGFDRRAGVRLQVELPGDRPDSIKSVLSGRADVGVTDIQDLALARERGADLVAFAALVNRPLAALITREDVTRPRQLEGKTVGVSGLPSDPAFLEAVMRADGGDPKKVKQVTIGFNGVSALAARKVAAVPMFWNIEGVILKRKGVRVHELRVEDYGAPAYPEVVLFATRRTVERRRADLIRLVRALADGLRSTLQQPRAVAEDIARAALTDDVGLVEAQVKVLRDVVDTNLAFDAPVLNRWADFAQRIGLVQRRPDVDRAFVTTIAGPRPTG